MASVLVIIVFDAVFLCSLTKKTHFLQRRKFTVCFTVEPPLLSLKFINVVLPAACRPVELVGGGGGGGGERTPVRVH